MTIAEETISSLYSHALRGPNEDYYLARFKELDARGEGHLFSWNWSAFFFTATWALYRRQYLLFVACVVFFLIANALYAVPSLQGYGLTLFLLLLGVSGGYSNAIYRGSVRRSINSAREKSADPIQTLRPRNPVLPWVRQVAIAIPVVGILAAVVLPKLAEYKSVPAAVPITVPSHAEKFESSQPIPKKPNPFDQFDEPQQPLPQLDRSEFKRAPVNCDPQGCTSTDFKVRYNLQSDGSYLSSNRERCLRDGELMRCN